MLAVDFANHVCQKNVVTGCRRRYAASDGFSSLRLVARARAHGWREAARGLVGRLALAETLAGQAQGGRFSYKSKGRRPPWWIAADSA